MFLECRYHQKGDTAWPIVFWEFCELRQVVSNLTVSLDCFQNPDYVFILLFICRSVVRDVLGVAPSPDVSSKEGITTRFAVTGT